MALPGTRINSPVRRGIFAALALVCALLPAREATAGLITGQVFVDYDGNAALGVTEYGIQGVVITAYNTTGISVGTAQTSTTGTYSLNASGSGPFRIEFTQIPNYLYPGRQTGGAPTTVRFLEASSASQFDLPLIDPVKYNTAASPDTLVSQFVSGTHSGAHGTKPGILKVPYTASGHDFSGTTPLTSYQATAFSAFENIGATYALAHQTTRNRLYAAAYHKRHSGFGPGGPDAVYVFDALTGSLMGTLKLDAITGTPNSAGADVHNFTPIGGLVYDIGSNANLNTESFDGVGKRAFGDMEMSADMKTLYVVNLFDRKIYALDVSSGSPADAQILHSWNAPDATGSTRHRPFALAVHEGKLWIGSVDENGSAAYIHSFTPSGAQPVFTLEVTLPLNYPRQAFIGAANNPNRRADWRAWADSPASLTPMTTNANEISWPQPMLTDIEFDGRNMILGLRDRFGDQAGYAKRFNLSSPTDSLPISAGDLLLVCRTETGWAIEGSPECLTSGGLSDSGPGLAAYPEHYEWDIFNDGSTWDVQNTAGGLHWETTQGGLLQLAGKTTLMTTAMNTFSDFSGGLLRFENATGRREGITSNNAPTPSNGAYTLYEGGDFDGGSFPADLGYFNEANGLGAIEALLEPPPIQVGNRLWLDANNNGIQDAGEMGIPNVDLHLYNLAGERIASTQSANSPDPDVHGTYSFDDLSPETPYIIVIDPTAFNTGGPLAGLRRTLTGAGSSLIDSNGIILSGLTGDLAPKNGLIGLALTTGDPGASDHTFDFGFIPCPALSISPPSLPLGRIGEFYLQEFSASAQGASLPFAFTISAGTPPSGIVLSPSGLFSGTPTAAGLTTFTVQASDAEGCRGTRTLELRICPSITLSPTSLPPAPIHTAYSVPLAANGGTGPYTFVLAEGTLPAGLTLTNGVITGTPTGPSSTSQVVFRAIDSNGCDGSIELTLAVTTATLSGVLYLDTNASGARESGELGLPDIDIQITSENGHQQTVSTSHDGTWNAQGVPGNNTITVVTTDPDFPIGAVQSQGTSPQTLLTPAGQTTSTGPFGFVANKTSWPAWQYLNPLGGQNAPADNPDGDRYDNLQEFAFCFPPNSGFKPHCPIAVTHDPSTGLINVRVLRVTGINGVTYHLERLPHLALSPSGWTDVTTLSPSITYNADGSEWATYADVAQLDPTLPSQFFRIRVELDADLNGSPEVITRTQTAGYYRRPYATSIQSLSVPFVACDLFAGRVDSVIGSVLTITTSIGTGNFTTALSPGVEYYVEVLSGDNAGHRFEVNEAASTANGIALDPGNALNTLTSIPASLAGDQIAVRRHNTLNSLFHKPAFNATNNPTTASRIIFYQGGTFRFYWLFNAGGNPRWVLDGDFLLREAGNRIFAPSEGCFIHTRNSTPTITLTGLIRSTPFATRLTSGPSLIAGGWPMEQTPLQRNYTHTAGFSGSNSSATADRLLFWSGDSTVGLSGYDGHFLLRTGPLNHWTTEKNSSLINQNNVQLFQPLRSVLIRSRVGLSNHVQANPWTP
jgi:hypothetical protein